MGLLPRPRAPGPSCDALAADADAKDCIFFIFWIFDARVWDRVRKDNFNLQYDQLEARPRVPKPKQTQQGKDGKETFQGQQAANARARSENGEQSALAGNGGSGASL